MKEGFQRNSHQFRKLTTKFSGTLMEKWNEN